MTASEAAVFVPQTLRERRERLLVAAIALGAFALRLIALGRDSLWYDETVSVYLAGQRAAELIAHTARDIHPPLYYLLLRGWLLLAGYPTGHADPDRLRPGVHGRLPVALLRGAAGAADLATGAAAGAGQPHRHPGRAAGRHLPLRRLVQPGSAHVHPGRVRWAWSRCWRRYPSCGPPSQPPNCAVQRWSTP